MDTTQIYRIREENCIFVVEVQDDKMEWSDVDTRGRVRRNGLYAYHQGFESLEKARKQVQNWRKGIVYHVADMELMKEHFREAAKKAATKLTPEGSEIEKAMAVLREHLIHNKDYFFGWQANIATCISDAYYNKCQKLEKQTLPKTAFHEMCHEAALIFLNKVANEPNFEENCQSTRNQYEESN